MKKLLLFLLILALFLTGCNTPPADEETTPPTVDGGDETPNNEQGDKAPTDSDDDSTTKPTFTIKYPEPKPEKKPPAVPITNKNDPQDETAPFLFVFDVKYGEFARGATIDLEIELTNNTGAAHGYIGAGGFLASPRLYCINNGEEYVLIEEPVTLPADATYREIENGESKKHTFYYNIPEDAPLGEYTLTCFYKGFRKDFVGYFTLTQ